MSDDSCKLSINERVANDANASFRIYTLCSVCRNVLEQSRVISGAARKEKFEHHQTVIALNNSALDGCHLCSLLLSRLPLRLGLGRSYIPTSPEWLAAQQHGNKKERKDAEFYLSIINLQSVKKMCLKNWFYADMRGVSSRWLYIDEAKDSIQLPSKLSLSTASEMSFQLARRWITCCSSNHDMCNRAIVRAPHLPTRLLSVNNAYKLNAIRLCLSREIVAGTSSKSVEYVTLSHRWGRQPILQLTTKNMENFMHSIQMNTLPLTFQHAVLVTRRLGFSFLWIDSLCIVQDSSSDWNYESSIMGEIYRGSVLTIAALGARDSNGGCFQHRNPLMTVPLRLNDGTQIKPRSPWEHVPLSGELLKRGWVVQERLLSLRTLWYTSWGLAWECIETQLTEEGGVHFGETPKADYYGIGVKPELVPTTVNSKESLLAFYARWIELVQVYSSTDVTRYEDKLVAFHGIVTDIENRTGLSSVAGLWKEILLIELLWRTENPQYIKKSSYRAPSWSWAALNTQVTNQCTELFTPLDEYPCSVEWLSRVMDAQSDEAANGEITNARVRLEGPLRSLVLNGEAPKRGLLHQEREWASIFGHDENTVKSDWGFHDGTITRSKVFPDYKLNPSKSQLYVIWICQIRGREARIRQEIIEPRMIDIGLVLEAIDLEHNIFQRRGYFEQYFYAKTSSRLFGADQLWNVQCITII